MTMKANQVLNYENCIRKQKPELIFTKLHISYCSIKIVSNKGLHNF
jgi:hypothetical protein